MELIGSDFFRIISHKSPYIIITHNFFYQHLTQNTHARTRSHTHTQGTKKAIKHMHTYAYILNEIMIQKYIMHDYIYI